MRTNGFSMWIGPSDSRLYGGPVRSWRSNGELRGLLLGDKAGIEWRKVISGVSRQRKIAGVAPS